VSCEQNHLLSAYLDGELSAADAQRVDEHLASCPACSAELDDLRAVGRLMGMARQSKLGEPSDDVMDRLRMHVHQLVDTSDYGLLRIARLFSGLAATVLIAGLWLLHNAGPVGPSVNPATGMRVAQTDLVDSGMPDLTSTAEPSEAVETPEGPDPASRESILEKMTGVELSSNRAAPGEGELP
jgi:predicted anti-sigma-YlaC factor YlaD